MLLLSRSQKQDADNILQTSSPNRCRKKKITAPRRVMTGQPFTNPPSGSLLPQSRLADASLFSRYKGGDLKARRTGQRQRRGTAGPRLRERGAGSGAAFIVPDGS